MTDEARQERFDEELRRWGSRPPTTAPRVAAARLRQRLRQEPSGRRRAAWWSVVSTVAAALALMVTVLRFGGSPDPVPARTGGSDAGPGTTATWETSPVAQGVVVIPLDEGTTLYLTLGAAAPAASPASAL